MDYLIIVLLGFLGGGACMFVGLDTKRRKLRAQKQAQVVQTIQIVESLKELRGREEQLKQHKTELYAKFEESKQEAAQELASRQEELDRRAARSQAEFDERQQAALRAMHEFEAKVISYKELQDENGLIKRDLTNLIVNLRKLELDHQTQQESHQAIDQRVQELGGRYLKENVKWIGNSLNANNFVNCKQRLQDVIERCREIGFQITPDEEATYVADLRAEYERVVRAALEREEQARIRAQIREELKREREIQRELERVTRDRSVLQAALEKALAESADQYSAEIESLKARLAEAEAKERAISQAQLTKAGFIYVISNIGSFGEGVFKVGMTRRLEPLERVKELGDASVPFPFDVHMMISCENAPTLENALHRRLLKRQINKTNPRKEFFNTDIETIIQIVKEEHGDVQYVADAEALQYRQSLTMSDEDQEFIDHVFDEAEEEEEISGDEPSQPVLSSE